MFGFAALKNIEVVGRRTRDAHHQKEGSEVVTVDIAVTDRSKNKNGEFEETPVYFRAILFGKVAELSHKYLKKGNMVYASGELKVKIYEKDGDKRFSLEIMGNEIRALTPKDKTPSPDSGYTDSEPAPF